MIAGGKEKHSWRRVAGRRRIYTRSGRYDTDKYQEDWTYFQKVVTHYERGRGRKMMAASVTSTDAMADQFGTKKRETRFGQKYLTDREG